MLEVKKILIIETAFIGDAVLSLALAEEIKRLRPDVEIDYLVAPASASLVSYAPSVARVHSFDKRGEDAGEAGIRKVADSLNKENFDIVISLHESHRTAKVIALLNATYKIGSASAKALQPYLTHRYELPTSGSRAERIIEFARFFSNTVNTSTLPKLRFDTLNVPTEIIGLKNIVVLAPGSAWKTKKWLPDRFIEVGAELVRSGNTVVIIGGEGDKVEAIYIANAIGTGIFNYAGAVTMPVAGAIISRAKLVIGNDSAPIHIATACGVKVVEIMGPTVQSFGFVPPPELGIVVEQEGLWCRPCNSHGGDTCPVYTHECMKSITSEMVINAATKQLVNAAS